MAFSVYWTWMQCDVVLVVVEVLSSLQTKLLNLTYWHRVNLMFLYCVAKFACFLLWSFPMLPYCLICKRCCHFFRFWPVLSIPLWPEHPPAGSDSQRFIIVTPQSPLCCSVCLRGVARPEHWIILTHITSLCHVNLLTQSHKNSYTPTHSVTVGYSVICLPLLLTARVTRRDCGYTISMWEWRGLSLAV